LPVGGGLLYVEPIYVQAKSTSAYPLNRAVIAAFGDKLAWSTTLNGALDALFGGNAGATSADNTPANPATPGTPTPPPPPGGTANNPALTQALADAQKALNDGDAALKAGDFTKYGEAQARLKAAITAAMAASPGGGSVTLTPGGTPTGGPATPPATPPAAPATPGPVASG